MNSRVLCVLLTAWGLAAFSPEGRAQDPEGRVVMVFLDAVDAMAPAEIDFLRALGDELIRETPATEVKIHSLPEDTEVHPIIRFHDGEQLTLQLPASNVRLYFEDPLPPAKVIFIHDMHLPAYSDGAGDYEFTYSSWDNEKGRLESYGSVHVLQTTDPKRVHALAVAQMKHGHQPDFDLEPARGKSFHVRILSNINLHLRDQPDNDPRILDQYEDLAERPSMANYFSNEFSLALLGEYIFPAFEERMSVGFEYNRETLTRGSKDFDLFELVDENEEFVLLLDQEVQITTYSLVVGAFMYETPKIQGFLKGRLGLRQYEGTLFWEDALGVIEMDDAATVGLSAGGAFEMAQAISLYLEVGYAYSKTALTTASYGETRFENLDFDLSDSRVFIRAGLSLDILMD